MSMRNLVLATASAAIIALPLADATAADIRVGYTQDAKTLDPANHRSRITEGIIRNMYDGLVARDDQMRVWPELAESYNQIDETTYDFKLRKGVKFHDGSEMTSEDVKFTFDRLTKDGAMGGQTSPRKSLLGPMAETSVVDKYTVRFKFKNAWPVFPRMLPFQEVVSKAFVEKMGTDGVATKVNGTGPFKLVDWRQGDSVIMERFDGYYGGADGIKPVGPAKADRIIFRIIPESASRVAALLAGEVDLINELPVHSMKRVEDNPRTKVLKTLGTRSFFVLLNNTKPPFNDARVRQAANHAVNKQLIIDRILNGLATPINGILSPQSFGHNPNLPVYDYDPAKAKSSWPTPATPTAWKSPLMRIRNSRISPSPSPPRWRPAVSAPRCSCGRAMRCARCGIRRSRRNGKCTSRPGAVAPSTHRVSSFRSCAPTPAATVRAIPTPRWTA